MMKNPELTFLEVLRFFIYINNDGFNRFITNGSYITTNIEKAREILSKNDFKKMYVPLSGVEIRKDYNILKNIRGIKNKIKVINDHFYILDELKKLDNSGLFLFNKDETIYRIIFYNNVTTFREIGKLSGSNFNRFYSDNQIEVKTEDVLEYVNKNFTPSNFNFSTYYRTL
jgi:hypothetical protein